VGPTENFPYLPMRPAPLPSHVAASPSPITRRRIPMDRRRPSSDAPLPAAARSTRSCQQLGNADLISFAPGLSPLLCSQRRSRGCGAAATRRDVSLALSSVHQRSCHGARDRPLPDQTTTAMDVIVNHSIQPSRRHGRGAPAVELHGLIEQRSGVQFWVLGAPCMVVWGTAHHCAAVERW
jgi:hypothetical protein